MKWAGVFNNRNGGTGNEQARYNGSSEAGGAGPSLAPEK
jgi:hypothetical protein